MGGGGTSIRGGLPPPPLSKRKLEPWEERVVLDEGDTGLAVGRLEEHCRGGGGGGNKKKEDLRLGEMRKRLGLGLGLGLGLEAVG